MKCKLTHCVGGWYRHNDLDVSACSEAISFLAGTFSYDVIFHVVHRNPKKKGFAPVMNTDFSERWVSVRGQRYALHSRLYDFLVRHRVLRPEVRASNPERPAFYVRVTPV